jgi:bifunctional UDP-N-acetylglucosamine pyrophosphorylase/glucosamine-1-phosphate N-acetyltransferase
LGDPAEAIGINTRVHLAEAEALLRRRINTSWMLAGVTILDPLATYIGPDVKIGQDAVIFPGTHLYGSTSIGAGSLVGPNSLLVDSQVGAACKITSSVLEGAVVEDAVEIGPFCHLRPGAHLATSSRLGNFSEVSETYLGRGVKVDHFAYLDSASLGENAEVGAGAVVKGNVPSGASVMGAPVRPVTTHKGHG